MIRFLFPRTRTLRRALADERRRNRALQETCADLRAYQERLRSDLRFLRQQNIDLTSENERAFALVTQLKAQASNIDAQRTRDENGRFAR